MQSESGNAKPDTWQSDFLDRNRLERHYLQTAAHYFDPLAARLAEAAAGRGPTLVALNGSQGSGKSTLCDYLVCALAGVHGVSAVALSLDDFYLTRAEREELARDVHPLFATRGVPGTHDMTLLTETIAALLDGAGSGEAGDAGASGNGEIDGTSGSSEYRVPAFDKSRDDRAAPECWPRVKRPLQLVLLEGWCLGARSEAQASLATPANSLERDEDPKGLWRSYSNRCLKEHYEPFYQSVDFWVMLAAPGFDQVLSWRTEQERKLAARVDGRGSGLMDDAGLRRFVAHYERHTRQCLRDLPAVVDVLINLDEHRRIVAVRGIEADK